MKKIDKKRLFKDLVALAGGSSAGVAVHQLIAQFMGVEELEARVAKLEELIEQIAPLVNGRNSS